MARLTIDQSLFEELTQPGGPLALDVLLQRPQLQMPAIMQARAMSALVQRDPRIANDPRTPATVKWLRNKTVGAYAKYRRNPIGWDNWLREYAGTYLAHGPEAADALPTPSQWPAGDRRNALLVTGEMTRFAQLLSSVREEVPAEFYDDDGTESATNRAARAAHAARRRQWEQNRGHLLAITRAVVAGKPAPDGHSTAEVIKAMSTPERVCMDYATIERLGRPVPGATGHTLGETELPSHAFPWGYKPFDL